MLTLTSPVEFWLHRVPAGLKLAALAAFTATLFAIAALPALAVAFALVVALHLPGGRLFAIHAARMLWPVWPFVAVLLLWHLATGDLRAGATIVLRMVCAIAAANLVTMTTRLSDMIDVLEWLAKPLSPVLPARRLALAIAMVIRFIPTLADRLRQIAESWAARSPRRAGWRVLVPATLAALDDADHAAEALRARGGAE